MPVILVAAALRCSALYYLPFKSSRAAQIFEKEYGPPMNADERG
jgi:hypothetical protein